MKIFGILLVVLGILGFVFGGFEFKRDKEVADLGPIKIHQQETRSLPVSPLASGAILVAGLVLVVVGARKR